jgi:hypothetical protein
MHLVFQAPARSNADPRSHARSGFARRPGYFTGPHCRAAGAEGRRVRTPQAQAPLPATPVTPYAPRTTAHTKKHWGSFRCIVLARYMWIYMWVLHGQCTGGVAHEQHAAFGLPASLVTRQVTQVSSPYYYSRYSPLATGKPLGGFSNSQQSTASSSKPRFAPAPALLHRAPH